MVELEIFKYSPSFFSWTNIWDKIAKLSQIAGGGTKTIEIAGFGCNWIYIDRFWTLIISNEDDWVKICAGQQLWTIHASSFEFMETVLTILTVAL